MGAEPTDAPPAGGWRRGRARRSWLRLQPMREPGKRRVVKGIQNPLLSYVIAAALALVWVPGGSCCCLGMSMFGSGHVTMGALSVAAQRAPRGQFVIAHQDHCCPSCLDISNAPAAAGASVLDMSPPLSGASQPFLLSIARWQPRFPGGRADLYHGPPAYLHHNNLLL